ncbi:hypothetical protein ACGF7W_05730 [Streptomyces sp. NPDC048219]|uniref:hypothetical protein n=1 Tax=Streptomyces sp. NPDC048219 TaxID=3365517 RepID=UPI0037183064
MPPQSEAVRADTDVITVGVGGNTLGFADLLAKCPQLGGESEGQGAPCKDALAASTPAQLKKLDPKVRTPACPSTRSSTSSRTC